MCNIVHVSCMYLFQQSAKTKDKKALNKIQIKSRQNNNQQKINILNYSKQIKQKNNKFNNIRAYQTRCK